ncbi:MAG: hypothetical protein COA64_03130 [Henriciella sp.]|nr:MAG: hypothetical protein COA64_03130 [Henriciella sp.]
MGTKEYSVTEAPIPTHFSKLKSKLALEGWDEGEDRVSMSREGFKSLIEALLRNVEFDEDWYLESYPDVRQGLEKGVIESLHRHYLRLGYYEGRLPGLKSLDLEKYEELNPDILRGAGEMDEAQKKEMLKNHFVEYGYKEGRRVGAV